jgi:formate-dependent nitrite reductase membrane component NrfD
VTEGTPAGAGRGFPAARSYLYGPDTLYREHAADGAAAAAAARAARGGPLPGEVAGPVMKAPVWTWEVPLYMWLGGIAAGSSFVSLAADLAGDRRSAVVARRVALGAVAPCPALLVSDLGRPERFAHMLRVFKPRSPMSMGAWCLTVFGALAGAAVAADLTGRNRAARAIGAVNAAPASYLGSYTGVLLASTAVPVWARSRAVLGPVFVSTAVATGAAATRIALERSGVGPGHPTLAALGRVETAAIASELALSALNERRLGPIAAPMRAGRAGLLFRAAKAAVIGGLALRAASGIARSRGHAGPLSGVAHRAASAAYLGGGLAFRYGWIEAGRASARDDHGVAQAARSGGR